MRLGRHRVSIGLCFPSSAGTRAQECGFDSDGSVGTGIACLADRGDAHVQMRRTTSRPTPTGSGICPIGVRCPPL